MRAIMAVRQRGGIVDYRCTSPERAGAVDYVLMMRDGKLVAFGPKDEVLSRACVRKNGRIAAEGSKTLSKLSAQWSVRSKDHVVKQPIADFVADSISLSSWRSESCSSAA